MTVKDRLEYFGFGPGVKDQKYWAAGTFRFQFPINAAQAALSVLSVLPRIGTDPLPAQMGWAIGNPQPTDKALLVRDFRIEIAPPTAPGAANAAPLAAQNMYNVLRNFGFLEWGEGGQEFHRSSLGAAVGFGADFSVPGNLLAANEPTAGVVLSSGQAQFKALSQPWVIDPTQDEFNIRILPAQNAAAEPPVPGGGTSTFVSASYFILEVTGMVFPKDNISEVRKVLLVDENCGCAPGTPIDRWAMGLANRIPALRVPSGQSVDVVTTDAGARPKAMATRAR